MGRKKRHHTPVAYLNSFCGEDGKILMYRKDDPRKVIPQIPKELSGAFDYDYYSQPLPDGGMDHDTLEDFFESFETNWPALVQKLRNQDNINNNLKDIFLFISLQFVRVPRFRDACEKWRASCIKAVYNQLDETGKFPSKPKIFEDKINNLKISINPHMSIHDMRKGIEPVQNILAQLSFLVLENRTDVPFLTSDNPVIWYDPTIQEDRMEPYTINANGPVVLLFPLTPELLLYGASNLPKQLSYDKKLLERNEVEVINQRICQFAYKAVFAQKTGQEEWIHKYATKSPILQIINISSEREKRIISRNIFGKRECKPKWKSGI